MATGWVQVVRGPVTIAAQGNGVTLGERCSIPCCVDATVASAERCTGPDYSAWQSTCSSRRVSRPA